MATVNLSGLPFNSKLPKLVILFKSLFKRDGITKFWIKEMADMRGTDLKSAKIEFNSLDEAYLASGLLNGFEYNDGQYLYRLSSRVDSSGERGRPRRMSPSPYNRPRRREYQDHEPNYGRYDGYARDRSRSPIGHQSTKLDLEIELLRKQRMIIEEERRILLERKKLELVKEFGPSALKEFKSLEDDRDRERNRDRDRRYRPERAEYRPRRRSPPPRPPPPPRQRPPKPMQLPQFLLPVKLILAELKETMERLGTRKESFLLTKLIRATIRKRLAVALEGKPIMSGTKIVALYREKYPKNQDEDFVNKHLNDIRASHMISKGDEAVEKPAKSSEKGKEKTKVNGTVEKVDAGSAKADAIPAVRVKVEPKEKVDETTETTVKEEPDTSAETLVNETTKSQEQNETPNQPEQVECNHSVGSNEALTLHDKNDEDWAEGENGWDDTEVQAAGDQPH